MDEVKVSVIIPVYNVEQYISECVISLLKQDLLDAEFIFINDGSLDSSIEILKQYSDYRIRIVNQCNSGLSAARNTGIKESKGKYILFLDSDDYLIKNNVIREMYKLGEANNSDIVVGNAAKVYGDGNRVEFYRDKEIFFERAMDSREFLKEFIKKDSMQVPVWMNLYNRKFLLKNNIFFKEGILHEDELFTPQVFLKADKVAIYPYSFYAYRQRENSIMTSSEKSKKRCTDMLNICSELHKIYSSIDDKELKKQLSKKTKWLIWNTINTNNLKTIPVDLKLFLLENSNDIKEFIRSIILSINLKLYKKIIGIK